MKQNTYMFLVFLCLLTSPNMSSSTFIYLFIFFFKWSDSFLHSWMRLCCVFIGLCIFPSENCLFKLLSHFYYLAFWCSFLRVLFVFWILALCWVNSWRVLPLSLWIDFLLFWEFPLLFTFFSKLHFRCTEWSHSSQGIVHVPGLSWFFFPILLLSFNPNFPHY